DDDVAAAGGAGGGGRLFVQGDRAGADVRGHVVAGQLDGAGVCGVPRAEVLAAGAVEVEGAVPQAGLERADVADGDAGDVHARPGQPHRPGDGAGNDRGRG